MQKSLSSLFTVGFVFISLSSCTTTTVRPAMAPSSQAVPTAAPGASSEIPARREFPINGDVNPCDDFFEHSCSKVNASFKLREDRSKHIFAFSDSAERLLEEKKKFMTNLTQEKKLSRRGQQLKEVYLACMNEDARKKEEVELVKKNRDELEPIQSNKEFQDFLASKYLTPDFKFIDFGPSTSLEDPNTQDIYFLAELQSLPERSYYDKPEVVADFQAILADFFKILGYSEPEMRAARIVAFEKEFSKTYPLPAEFRELFSKKTEIKRADLLKNYSSFEFQKIFSVIPKNTLIRNISPDNYGFVQKALTEGDVQTLKDIYVYQNTIDEMDDAYPEFYQKRFEFRRKHLGGPQTRPVRQERCTQLVMAQFNKELDAELLPRIFPNFPEKKFIALAEKVRGSIIEGLRENTWLSPAGKKSAMLKMKSARLQLVKPRNDKEWDFTPIARYSTHQHYKNLKTYSEVRLKKMLAELKIPRDRNRWSMSPLTVNAYYSPSDNKFVMPIGILQYPFYDPALPEEVNLGAVGAVIGHELGHGIDDQGAKYDSTGKLQQWMTDEDLKNFGTRGTKMVAQFEKAGHNGKLTLGENIGDLVGVTFAYRAAFLKNPNATTEQKKSFFYQYARAWCGVIRPKMREMLLKTDPHSLVEARVNEQVKHQPGFQEAFQCKPSDKMVLSTEERVKIW